MNVKKALTATALSAGVALAASGCGGHGGYGGGYPTAEYCVDSYGHVEPVGYCDYGYRGGGTYFIYVGSVHGNSYRTGQTIPRTYFNSGKRVSSTDTTARQKAGLPVTTSFTNGAKAPKAAAKQVAPKKDNGKTSVPSTSKTTKTKSTSSTTKPKSSTTSPKAGTGTKSSGGSGFSSSKSSGGGSSSGHSSGGGGSSSRSSSGSSSGRK